MPKPTSACKQVSDSEEETTQKICKVCKKAVEPEFYEKQKRLLCRSCHNSRKKKNQIDIENKGKIINITNQYAHTIVNNITTNNTYYKCTFNTTVHQQVMKPLVEYDTKAKKYKEDYEKGLTKVAKMRASLKNCTEKEAVKIQNKISKVIAELGECPDYGEYFKSYEKTRKDKKANPSIPTQDDVKELTEYLEETLNPTKEEKDEKGNKVFELEVFNNRAERIFDELAFYDFYGVANTENLIKLKKKVEAKFNKINEKKIQALELVRKRAKEAYEKARKEKEEREQKEKEIMEKRIEEFNNLDVNTKELDLSGNIELPDWTILRRFVQLNSIDITNNSNINRSDSDSAIQELANLEIKGVRITDKSFPKSEGYRKIIDIYVKHKNKLQREENEKYYQKQKTRQEELKQEKKDLEEKETNIMEKIDSLEDQRNRLEGFLDTLRNIEEPTKYNKLELNDKNKEYNNIKHELKTKWKEHDTITNQLFNLEKELDKINSYLEDIKEEKRLIHLRSQ